MKLLNFSVSNYRSITQAHRVSLSETTVLIGKNNEGKSNFLKALDVAMTILQQHAIVGRRGGVLPGRISRRDDSNFYWERDFPITLQMRKGSTQTVFRLEFLLEAGEIELFRKSVGSNLNGSLPIEVKIGKDNKPSIKVVDKRGRGATSLNEKSGRIADFIGKNI